MPQHEVADQQAHSRQPQSQSITSPKRTASSSSTDPKSPPSKRPCTALSPRNFNLVASRSQPSIESILHLPLDAVWGMRKTDLRECFLALQKYALNPHPFECASSHTPTTVKVTPAPVAQPAILRLPLEIRELIYNYILPLPIETPIRGPHPRQLQNALHLTQPIVPSLLSLNHQIRSEVLPILFGCPSQVFHISIDYNIWVHKTLRSPLILSSNLTSSIRHVHIHISLGSEKKPLSSPSSSSSALSSSANSNSNSASTPKSSSSSKATPEAEARLLEVRKGIKKLGKWLSGADIQNMWVSWQEPPQTFSWETKKDTLDGLRGLRAKVVEAGEINWGLNWNKGRRYRFEVDYLKMLERGRQVVDES